MHVALLTDEPYLEAALRPILALDGAALSVVASAEALLALPNGHAGLPLALLDCSGGRPQDLLVCLPVLAAGWPACLIHPRESVVRALGTRLDLDLGWLGADLPLRTLRDLLHLHRALPPRSSGLTRAAALSARELQVQALAAIGCSQREIAILLGVTTGAVKSYGARHRSKEQAPRRRDRRPDWGATTAERSDRPEGTEPSDAP